MGTTQGGSGVSTGAELEGVVGTRGQTTQPQGQGRVRAVRRARISFTFGSAPSAALWMGSRGRTGGQGQRGGAYMLSGGGNGGPAQGCDLAGAEE